MIATCIVGVVLILALLAFNIVDRVLAHREFKMKMGRPSEPLDTPKDS